MLRHIVAAALLAASGLAGSEASASSFETHLDGSLCVDIKGGRIVVRSAPKWPRNSPRARLASFSELSVAGVA